MVDDFTIFIVDDDAIILDILKEILAEEHRVETFGSAADCLARVAVAKPDMFIIDLNMPAMDGYALCRHLKEDFETSDIPVTIISGDGDMETRLAGYEAGAEDFIVKPIEAGELESKVRVARRILTRNRALSEQAGYAQRTAFSAMTSMGELSAVLQFLSRSFACVMPQELGEALLDALEQYGLHGAVQLRLGQETLSISRNGVDLPLEVSVLNHVRSAGRIFQFKTRCVFNYGQLTLMINNMPVEDAERCGRIRDNGALLAEGADARLRAIAIDLENRHRQRGAAEALPRVHSMLELVQSSYRRNCYELTHLMIEYQEKLVKSFVHLGLTDKQEEFISHMSQDFMQRMAGTQDETMTVITQLESLAGELESLAGEGVKRAR